LGAAFAKEDRFRRGPAANWAESTRRRAVITALCRWLGFLALFEPSALAEHPLDRLTEDRLIRYLDYVAETVASVGQYVYFEHLLRALRVMFPGEVPDTLNILVRALRRECRPRPKEWIMTPLLIVEGQNMIEEALRKDGAPRKVLFRDGLMLMLWPPRPLRRRAFAQIQIGKHLRRVGEEWRLIFDGSETKSGRPVQFTVPRRVAPFLDRFLEEVRTMFVGAADHDALWVSSKGRPLSPDAISIQIAKRTQAAFGTRIPAHRLRHCAASTLAAIAPGQIGLASELLEHATLRTTGKHYILMARGIEASRLYAKRIAEAMPKRSRRRRHRRDS
jgi:integrase